MSEGCGVVAGYDSAAGIGTITADDGATLPFQCVGIADGSREIDAGARVRFRRLPRLGRVEATHIESLGDSARR